VLQLGIELFVSLHSGNNRIRTVCCCGALCSSSVDGFLGCQFEMSETAPALQRGLCILGAIGGIMTNSFQLNREV
jgi:hypothetical protein